jgi:NAD(P)H-dependent flavin oxidoreductase YrpB (nitropropane dioxygenase family)
LVSVTRRAAAFCELLGIQLPIVQAPVGNISTPELAAAVSNAGGLGMIGASGMPLDRIEERLRATAELTGRPFGANVILAISPPEAVDAVLDAGVKILSLFWGEPAPFVDRAHQAGALVLSTVGTAREAREAVAAGVDIVVAQGWEAGGHVRGTVSTLALVPRVVDEVDPVPVIAAGGIADGRGVAAVLALGAAAAWLGTRFVAAEESAAHPVYRQMLADAAETDTVYSTLFDQGWPHAPHRTLRNSTVSAWHNAGEPAPGGRPGEDEVVARRHDGTGIRRYAVSPPNVAVTTGEPEAMAVYAGQGVGLITGQEPAADIVRRLMREAEQALTG